MIIIKHRVNDPLKAAELNKNYGLEVDVRYHEDDLVLDHDPFGHHENKPKKLEDLLSVWKGDGPLILNVKTEGVEEKCLELVEKHSVKNWFFLDLSMPYFVKYSLAVKEKRFSNFSKANLAVRFSEFEPIEYALSFAESAEWVWIDFFTKSPLDKESYDLLKEHGFKICLVSPELQGHTKETIKQLKSDLKNFDISAVCTKHPDLWM